MALKRNCDLHMVTEKKVVPATYDAKTKQGPWAYVCDEHLESHCVSNSQLRTKLSEVQG